MYTTSRSAPADIRRFARMKASRAGERFMERGRRTVDELADTARRNGEDNVFIVCQGGRKPLVMAIQVMGGGEWRWITEAAKGGPDHENDMHPASGLS